MNKHIYQIQVTFCKHNFQSKNDFNVAIGATYKIDNSILKSSCRFIDFVFTETLKAMVPINEFKKRIDSNDNFDKGAVSFEIDFWLMPDNKLYETTNITIEGEWYFLSDGVSGRMADGTDMDYTEFLIIK